MKTIKNLTAEQLRKSILQIAIQGKLVKQDPNDEPASELVKRIYEEKQRLIKEGKIKKDKSESYIYKGDDNRYYEKVGKEANDITDQLPFEIPDSWAWIRLSAFCDIYTGDSISETDKEKIYRQVKNGLDYIGTKDVNFDHSINYDNGVKIPVGSNFRRCPKSKILLCIEGGSAGRKIGITTKEVCFGNKLACFNSWINNEKFLFLFLQSPLFLQLFKSSLTGIISGVSISNLKRLLMPLPPLNEQKRIADKYSKLEKDINTYESIETALTILESSFETRFKASILQYAIEGKLVKQDPNDEPASKLLERIKAEKNRLIKDGKIKPDKHNSEIVPTDDKDYYRKLPEKWRLAKVSDLGFLERGSGIKRADIISSGMPCIRYGEIYTTYQTIFFETVSYVSKSTFDNCRKARHGDILMTLTGENKTDIAKAVTYLGKNEIAFGGDMACLHCTFMNSIYLTEVLNSGYCIRQKREVATGDIIVHLSIGNLGGIMIPIPPKAEQDRIIMKLGEIGQILSQQSSR